MTHANRHPQIAVLSYHKIGAPPAGWDSCFYIPERVFADQLRALQELGWAVIDVAAFLAGLDEPDGLPPRAALITFDDGYRSNLTHAVPILEDFGYPAVMFVPTAFIGGANSFDAGVEPEETICNWDDLRELEERGVSVQSHGITHRAFSKLSDEEITTELTASAQALTAALQRPVTLFSFPYGDIGERPWVTKDLLRDAGYRAAFYSDGGLISEPPWTDPYGFLRVAMVPETNLQQLLRD